MANTLRLFVFPKYVHIALFHEELALLQVFLIENHYSRDIQ